MSYIMHVQTEPGGVVVTTEHEDRAAAVAHLRATYDPIGDIDHFSDDDVIEELRSFNGMTIVFDDESVPTADELAARIPVHVAQECVVRALAVAGKEYSWDSEMVEWVLNQLRPALDALGDVPDPFNFGDNDSDNFWAEVYES